jgi:hypothetical protein
VNHLRGFHHVARKQMRQGQAGACDAVFNGGALVWGWFFQHPIRNL